MSKILQILFRKLMPIKSTLSVALDWMLDENDTHFQSEIKIINIK